MHRKAHSDQNDIATGSDRQVQLELPIFQAQLCRPSGDVIAFRPRSEVVQTASARDLALRRILDFARTLPGK